MLELVVLCLTLITAVVGALSIYWARADRSCWRCHGGRVLFVVNLLAIGVTGLVAAFTRAQGLPPLGLVAGLLTIGMLWERPAGRPHSTPPLVPSGDKADEW